MHRLRFLFLSLLLLAAPSFADSVGFGLSSDLAAINYTADLSKSFGLRTDFFHSKVNNARVKPNNGASFRRDSKTDFVSIGLFNHGRIGIVQLYIGGEAFWLHNRIKDLKTYSVGGLGIAAQLDVTIIPQLIFSTGLHYSPDILTNGDYKSLMQFDLGLSYQIINSTSVYLAYRYINAWGKEVDTRIYNNPMIGVKFSF